MSGLIVSRDGDLVRVRDKKSHEVITVSIVDTTQIERKNHKLPFYRHTDMDVTALLPGLTIEAEGVANSYGQLEATKISFTPDDFAIEVTQQQQVLANKAAVQNAQSTANQAAPQPASRKVLPIRPRIQQIRLACRPKLPVLLDWRTRLRSQLSINAFRTWTTTRSNRRMTFSLTAIQRSSRMKPNRPLPILPNSRSRFRAI
jgi:hypothetical protein